MSVQTSVQMNIGNTFAGKLRRPSHADTVNGNATVELGMGLGLAFDNTVLDGVKLAKTVDDFVGVSVLDLGRESRLGQISYKQHDNVVIVRNGYIAVELAAAASAARGAGVFMHPTAGTFAATGGAGHTVDLSTKATFETQGAAKGDIVIIRVTA